MFARTPLLTAAALALAAPADHPTNVYEEGATWTLTHSETTAWTLDDMTQIVDGTEVEVGSPELAVQFERSFSLEDTYRKVADGAAVTRERTLSSAEGKLTMDFDLMGQREAHAASLSSPLDGAGLVCTVDEDSEEASFAFADDGDEALLVELHEDAELSMLPPRDVVEEGESWVVDLADRPAFFAPGGHLAWETELESQGFVQIQPHHVLATSLLNHSDAARDIEGELEVTWSATKGSDGERLAVLDLGLEAVLDADLSEELSRLCRASGLPDIGMVVTANVTVEGEGQALWDLDAGHLHSMELELSSELEMVIEWNDGSQDYRVEVVMSGASERTIELE